MGKGIDAARADAPEHAAVMDAMKDNLILVLMKRLGGKASIPVAELDDTGQDLLAFSVDENNVFHFEMQRKS